MSKCENWSDHGIRMFGEMGDCPWCKIDALRAELEAAQADAKHLHGNLVIMQDRESRLRAALEDVERLGRNANKNNKLAIRMGDVARQTIATQERTDV